MSDASVDSEAFRFTVTQDWFSHNIPIWSKFLPYVQASAPRVLEIGSWEGRSGVWLLRNLCSHSGSLVCIDHFDLMATEAGRQRYSDLVHNLTLAGPGQFRIMKSFSFPALMELLGENIGASDPGFDWIYVDGSHEADDTFLDAELAWRLARKGAVFIFDDYHWNAEPAGSIHHPKRGIDAFLDLHAGQYERLTDPSEYQVILQKNSDMRIGFLIEKETPPSLENAAGYGLNIALAFDSGYAPAAAVTIYSAVDHTPGRITFYIIERGLAYEDRDKLQASIPQNRQDDVTLVFMSMPETTWLPSSDMTWAKLQMLEMLPVQRVLYLDADMLVLADLRDLWRSDLGGKVVGAVVDVGHPRGHGDQAGHPYFNAGVLLFDLTSIRRSITELQKQAQNMSSSHFKDQDVLNAHFRGAWMELDLRWNAQGLGTYANNSTLERNALDLKHMCSNPYIVHFTGPLHPTLASVINPWVQPYTAKPWGYAGAPGHPFTLQWKETLESTQWRGWLNTSQYVSECVRQRQQHEAQALEAFREVIETRYLA